MRHFQETDSRDERVVILGVSIANVSMRDAIDRLTKQLDPATRSGTMRVYFVNTHTMNVAVDNPSFKNVLNDAHYVFADGTGVRWATRMRGIRLRDNVNGTDLMPALFEATAGRGYRVFLLGSKESSIERAAKTVSEIFPGWTLAGHHHGYVDAESLPKVIQQINDSGADMLLVGMGNPLQEQWIHDNHAKLNVSLAVGVGGLFEYWAHNLWRAPHFVRRLGCEWFSILLQQPHKLSRYAVGNPKFLGRAFRDAWAHRLNHARD